jgi:F0F1-type ATP synthase assembly protein I
MAAGGMELAVAILLGLFGGRWLDRHLGTTPFLLIAGVFAGAAAGFYSLIRALSTAEASRRSRRERDASSPRDDMTTPPS